MKTFKEFILESNQCVINSILFLCEGKYSDEDAFRKVWNHFITHKKYGSELRQFLRAKNFDGAREYMEREISAAEQDPKHPLSFEKAKRGFMGGKTPGDVDSYFDMLKIAPDSVTAFVKGRRGSNTSERVGVYARVSGGAKPPTSSEWQKETGKSSDTSKRDIEFVDPKNKKYGLGLSLKMGKGSQTISAEPDEAYATFQAAGREYIKRMKKQGASKEEINSFESQLNKTSQLVRKSLGFTSPQMTPKVNKELSDRRLSVAQKSIDRLFNSHPTFISQFDKEGAGGEAKFGRGVSSLPDETSPQVRAARDAMQVRSGEIEISGFRVDKNDNEEDANYKKLVRDFIRNPKKILPTLKSSPSGSAQEVVTGTNIDSRGNIVARAKSVSVSDRGRITPETGPAASAPKGMTQDPDVSRPANLKLRVSGSQEPKSNQAQSQQGPLTLQQFNRKAKLTAAQDDPDIQRRRDELRNAAKAQAQARHAQIASELEKQTVQTANDLEAAKKSAAAASIITTPDGTPVPRKNAFYLQNNPAAAQQHADKKAAATQSVQTAQDAHDTAVITHQTHLSTPPTPSKQQKPQPTSTAAPQQTTQPEPQPTSTAAPQQTTQPEPQQTPQKVQPSDPQPVEDPTKKKKPSPTTQGTNGNGQRPGVQ